MFFRGKVAFEPGEAQPRSISSVDPSNYRLMIHFLANLLTVLTVTLPMNIVANQVRLPSGVADLDHSEIRHANGQRFELSAREVQLLRYFAANQGRPVSRDEILLSVWRLDPRRLITRTIDMHVANLRNKLGDCAHNPKVLLTVRGQGYMFAAPNGD